MPGSRGTALERSHRNRVPWRKPELEVLKRSTDPEHAAADVPTMPAVAEVSSNEARPRHELDTPPVSRNPQPAENSVKPYDPMPWQWSQPLNEAPGAKSLSENPPDVSPAPAQSDGASALLSNAPSAKDTNSDSAPASRDQKLTRLREEQTRIREQRKRVRLLLQLEEEEQRVQAEIDRLENE